MAVQSLIEALSELPVESDRSTVWLHVRARVYVETFGAHADFGEANDEGRFRIDEFWPERKPRDPWHH